MHTHSISPDVPAPPPRKPGDDCDDAYSAGFQAGLDEAVRQLRAMGVSVELRAA